MGKDKRGYYNHAYCFEWGLYENESLILLILFTYKDELYSDDEFKTVIERLDKTDFQNILKKIAVNDNAKELLNASLSAIVEGDLRCSGDVENFSNNPEQLKVDLLNYVKWAVDKEIDISYHIKTISENIYNEKLIDNCKNYKLSSSEINKLLHEPLWLLSSAILYLHGCQSLEQLIMGSSYKAKEYNFQAIKNHRHFYQVYSYANNARKIKALQFFGDYDTTKVKPKEFIEWSKSLNMDFPLYSILPKEISNKIKAETNNESYTTPYMQLERDCVDALKITYKNQPTKQVIIDWLLENAPYELGLKETRAKHMASNIRMPSEGAGGGIRKQEVTEKSQAR